MTKPELELNFLLDERVEPSEMRYHAECLEDDSEPFAGSPGIIARALYSAADQITTLAARVAELEARNADLVEALGQVIEDIDALISDSHGVAGLHLNGDVAPWSDLTEGGRFGEWLQQIEVARRALSRAKGESA